MFRGLPTDRTGAGARQPRSVRRYLAVLTATALATVALPMAAASAAPTSSAVLTAGQNVFPGASQFTVNVTNSRAVLGALGGETVNYVDIKLPNTAGIKTSAVPTAPAGWTATRTDAGSLQTYTFRGGSIAPGSSLPFSFPASVAAPLADRSGDFEVAVSSDNGRTTSGAAGALTTKIRTLRVVAGSLTASAPLGVTDQSGTAGQSIDYSFAVQNLARAAQTVTPSLSSNGDTVVQAPAASVAANAVQTFVSAVTLGGSANRTANFAASATASPSVADPVARPFTVQAPARLGLDRASFDPAAVRPGLPTTFTVFGAKSNAPALEIATSSLLLPGGVVADGGARNVVDNNPFELSFGPAAPTGPDGTYDVVARFSGQDDNDFAYAQEISLDDVLTLDAVGVGRQQTAASNQSDRLTINGDLDPSDCTPEELTVFLQPNVGGTIPVPVTLAGCAFTGSITTGGAGTTFVDGATSVQALASASDRAGNPGSAASDTTIVDLIAPVFTSAVTMGSSDTSTQADRILVTFEEANTVFGGCSATQWRVDGELFVSDVLYSDGTKCVRGQEGPDNSRVLVLMAPRDQDLQTNVTFTPGMRPFADRATDSAGQDALANTIATVSGVVPAAAELVAVTRGNGEGGREAATFDADQYWTNQAGSDLVVEFAGGRAGYSVRVLDEAGNRLATKQVGGSPETVSVPLGSSDGSYTRSLQLVNTTGLVSELTTFTVTLDRVLPVLAGATQTGTRTIDVGFSEPLATGTNFAEDWFATKQNPDEDPSDPDDDVEVYQISTVTGNGGSRTLTTNRDLAGSGAAGAEYLLRNPSAIRYEDRAGNRLADAGV